MKGSDGAGVMLPASPKQGLPEGPESSPTLRAYSWCCLFWVSRAADGDGARATYRAAPRMLGLTGS